MKSIIIKLVLYFVFIGCTESATNNSLEPEEETTTENSLPEVIGYPIVSTTQSKSYNNSNQISTPSVEDDFYGQDANYSTNEPKYQDNSDGTVTDLITGLMWVQSV